MKKVGVAMVCKLMPYYRLGVFQSLSAKKGSLEFNFYGDVVEQGGIRQIPFSYAKADAGSSIRWFRTRNYFYKPERLLWQTGIIKEIFGSKNKAFVFEGAIAHLPIWLFAFLCQLRGKKVFFWTHGNRGLDKGIKKAMRVVLFKWLADGLLLYGHTQKDIMVADGYSSDRLFVVYNSLQAQEQLRLLKEVDLKQVRLLKQGFFKNPEGFTFIFIGRLRAEKGVLKILELQKALKDKNIISNTVFIGEGPEKQQMLNFVKSNELDAQVHMAGELYQEQQLVNYFAMADLMVSPGNVGLNCIHSLAYGVPVLTHDDFTYQNPEVEAIIDGETGIYYRYGDDEDMFNKVLWWIENAPDRNLVKEHCLNKIHSLYNPQHQADCIEDAIQKSLS